MGRTQTDEDREWEESQKWYEENAKTNANYRIERAPVPEPPKPVDHSSPYQYASPQFQQPAQYQQQPSQSNPQWPQQHQQPLEQPQVIQTPPITIDKKLTQNQLDELSNDLLQRHKNAILNDEELQKFKNNAHVSKGCALAATGLIPYFLTSMLSIKYDQQLWMKHTKIGFVGIMAVGACFNYVCMEDNKFFNQMRVKYFGELTDFAIINFDEETKKMVAQKYRLQTQDYLDTPLPNHNQDVYSYGQQGQQQQPMHQQQPMYQQQPPQQPQYGQPAYQNQQAQYGQAQYGQQQQQQPQLNQDTGMTDERIRQFEDSYKKQ